MYRKKAFLFGAISAAAIGGWFGLRRYRAAKVETDAPRRLPGWDSKRFARLEIDDDTAADIIRRARPALETAASMGI